MQDPGTAPQLCPDRHSGGLLAYTPYNVAVHLAEPDPGGLRYDTRRPRAWRSHPPTGLCQGSGQSAFPQPVESQSEAAANSRLLEDVLQVDFHRAGTDSQVERDLLVFAALFD